MSIFKNRTGLGLKQKAKAMLHEKRNLLPFLKPRAGVGQHHAPEEKTQGAQRRLQKRTPELLEPDESISKHQIFHSLISPLKPGKMLDLGAGEGTFSLIAAHLGWEVTAVDARTARTPVPEAEENPDRAELVRSVRWIEADVREFPIRGVEYDLICIFGLLHRLELDDQIKLLRRCSDTLTFLTVRTAQRSVLSKEETYEGRHKREPGETPEERENIAWASWGNELSFKHTEESLLRLMRDCGYSHTMAMRPAFERSYTFYVGLPAPLNLEAWPIEAQEVPGEHRKGSPTGEASRET